MALSEVAARSEQWEVTLIEQHDSEGLLDYDVIKFDRKPKVGGVFGGVDDLSEVVEVTEIDEESKTATIVFKYL